MNDTLHIAISTHNLITILTLGFLSFLISMLITPIYTTISYEKQWWKRQRADAWSGGTATVYKKEIYRRWRGLSLSSLLRWLL
jgi:hypothetical protein